MVVSVELIQLLPGHGDVSVRYDGRVVSFATAQTSWTGPVIAAQFPQLEVHFSVAELHVISCDRAALREAVETAAVMPGVPLDLRGTGKALAVLSESTELGRVETLVPVDAPPDLAASFAGSYLRDALQLTAGERLTMRFGPRQVVIQCDNFTQLVLRVVDTRNDVSGST